MELFQSKIIASSSINSKKRDDYLKLCEQFQEQLKGALDQGSEKTRARHLQRGKLLARDRVELLLDEDTPFLELLPLAGCRRKERARYIAGIGIVCGIECMVTTYIPTIKGGSTNEISLKKSLRVMEICRENRLPLIHFVETAGADLREQAQVFHLGGNIFRNITMLSKAGIPSIAIVCGSSTAGGAYAPGLSDYTIMVKKQAQVFLAGPPLVKMATGEVADKEELGGAEMHSYVSGVSDYLAEDEPHSIFICRQIVRTLNYKKLEPLPLSYFAPVLPPVYDPEEILGIIGADLRSPYDSREVIARLVDGSQFHEWKPAYATTLVCGWARVHGFLVGILANNGVIFSDTSNKGAHFIELCDKRNTPLLYLQNITGFMVGKAQEQAGIIKHGSKLINAVSNAEVPAITVIMGASFGAGNYAMNGRAYKARFHFAWPGSKVAVMGSDQLVGVMTTISRDGAKRAGREFDEKKAAMLASAFKARVEAESDAYYCTSECLDDGIIDPRATRDVLGICLSCIYNATVVGNARYGIHRM